jgi:arsenate reductase (thioredoxin)
MAEAFLRHEAGDLYEVASAGTHPGSIRPEAITVMSQIGLDISAHRSKPLTELLGQHFDFIITVCDKAREECPTFAGETQLLHWPFEDPASFVEVGEKRLEAFRKLRDRIHSRVMLFLGEGIYQPDRSRL